MNKLVGVSGVNLVLFDDERSPFLAVRAQYLNVLEDFGVTPVLINNTTNEEVLNDYAQRLNGLLLSGGGDIHPRYYNNKKHALTGSYNMTINEKRDETELFLTRAFYRLKKPILGICRGCQIINVAFGGSLLQDINSNFPKLKEIHLMDKVKGGWYNKAHKVNLKKDSRLFKIIKEETIEVNSTHHQMVDRVGKNLIISAKSPEGINEAIEYTDDDNFIVGVQWHPEQMIKDKSSQRLLRAFVKAML